MLASLHIENIAVVRRADIEFGGGLTVLTGETGAGKSVIIDSLRLILGGRAQREQIRRGADSATVAGLFCDLPEQTEEALKELGIEPEDGEIYIQRTVGADGKGKILVCGRQIPLQLLREIGTVLIAVHGQHDNQKLMKQELHIKFLDGYAGNEELLGEYREAYSALSSLRRELKALDRDESEKARLTEMLNYQIGDIDAAHLRPGEDEELERRRKKIRSLEKLSRHIRTVYADLCAGDRAPSARDRISDAISSLEQLSDIVPDADRMLDRLKSCMIEVDDIGETVLSQLDDSEGDSTALLDKIESRLELISRLGRKYGAGVENILSFRDDAKRRLDEIENSDGRKAKLEKQIANAETNTLFLARQLSLARREAAERLSSAVTGELGFLEMNKARFGVEINETEPGADGIDDVGFMIAANPGDPLMPLHKTASGGELSRIMLALKCALEDKEGTGTLIFDEIDTGVSGRTAQKIGIKLRQLSKDAQVLCITHAAQIAALSDHHFLVSKKENEGRAETSVAELDEDGRTHELARIMGGEQITEKLLATARELRAISRG